jgi:hypothetical protein
VLLDHPLRLGGHGVEHEGGDSGVLEVGGLADESVLLRSDAHLQAVASRRVTAGSAGGAGVLETDVARAHTGLHQQRACVLGTSTDPMAAVSGPDISAAEAKSWEENMNESGSREGQSASERIDKRIAELGDWRGETLSRMRKLIKEADPDVVEEVKWVKATNPGTPTWSHDGIICTGETYKSVVKLTFAKGASLEDPAKLFNSSLEGNTRRAIDIREGEKVDAVAFKALIRAAVALNSSGGKARPRRRPATR